MSDWPIPSWWAMWANRSGHSQKWVIWANCSGPSPKMSDHEQFPQVSHQKWATMSKSLRSLTKNERITCFFERIAHSLNFSHKRAIRSENRWANSQPCTTVHYIQYPVFTIQCPCSPSCFNFLDRIQESLCLKFGITTVDVRNST